MLGVIRVFDPKGYGFLTDEAGVSRFFHVSNFEYGEPQPDLTVSFQPFMGPRGPSAVALRVINVKGGAAVIDEITQWKLDAKLEDTGRYFFRRPDIELLERGSRCYVIGRKGSGKTAIAEYLANRRDQHIHTKRLTFKNYPFNDLYALGNDRYTAPNQYITLWKYVIYSSIAQMMARNAAVPSSLRSTFAATFDKDPAERLPQRIRRWTSRSFGFSVLGTGIQVGAAQAEDVQVNWVDRVDALESLILQNLGDSAYVLVLDELDEDYKNWSDPMARSRYSALLTSLFKAVQDIKSVFGSVGAQVVPVVFIRDDIYDLIYDADRTKWLDLSYILDWTADHLRELVGFRLSRAFDPELAQPLPFDESWSLIFAPQRMPQTQHSLFDYMRRCGFQRPRDFVAYLKFCADAGQRRRLQIIDGTIVKEAEGKFSEYLLSDAVDEAQEALPDIRDVFGVISRIGKRTFRAEEFIATCREVSKAGRSVQTDPAKALELLYHFSIVGNVLSGDRFSFRHVNPDRALNPALPLAVHRGFLRALRLM